MSIRAATAVFLLLSALPCFTAETPECGHIAPEAKYAPPDSALFARLAEGWRLEYNAADSTALTDRYAPDCRYISSHVQGLVAEGRDRVIANFLRGARMGGRVDAIEVLSVHVSCDLAVLLCRYEADNAGVKASGRNLLVLTRAGGGWLIVLHMTVV